MKKIGICISLLLITVFIVCCFSMFGGADYKAVLNNYCKAYENNDADLMCSSVLARYYTNYMGEDWGYDGAEDFVAEDMEEDLEAWDCGEDVTITYKIKDERRATKEELVGLENVIFDWYATYSFEREDFSITDAYVLDIYFTVRGDGNMKQFYYPDGLLLVKENGKWRIGRGSIGCSFYDNNY